MLNGKQQSLYRPLVDSAWLAYGARNPGSSANCKAGYEKWYRETLVKNLGIYTTKEIKDEAQFDALCLVFATLGGDQTQIDYWSRAAERRALWRLQQTMKNAGVNWAYVQGIARNMNFIQGESANWIDDLPAELILKLNTAVFVHMKRKDKAAKAVAAAKEEDAELSFP